MEWVFLFLFQMVKLIESLAFVTLRGSFLNRDSIILLEVLGFVTSGARLSKAILSTSTLI
jgi:hypothetical protein